MRILYGQTYLRVAVLHVGVVALMYFRNGQQMNSKLYLACGPQSLPSLKALAVQTD
ncbi:hypothetical protein JZ751_005232 [Albula glossodonta]|uniref:Uncharacterized protein n=1 Tax=Albula glossodonta TaxID=121402 RepID=A0A8T2P701_9TELE|nr:hypothetical protein JZ751_005232 [Albula glossodonta]